MGKDLRGKEIGKGLRQRKDGRYEARAKINGVEINLYDFSLKNLKKTFEEAKEQASLNVDYKRKNITLNEWFDEWFTTYKLPNVKETSVYPMRSKYYKTFGDAIGDMKVVDIRNLDIQRVINELKNKGRASSTMREALGRVRECLESAKHNNIIANNPCFEVSVPWENTTKERRFLTQEEQERFLSEVDHNWYKEMFYIMFLTGLRVGEVGGLKWSDIDWERKCVNVERSLSCQYENGVKTMRLTLPKTQNSFRSIPFMGEAEEMLKSQKAKQERQRKSYGERWRAEGEFDDLVFTSSLGSPVTRYIAEKEIKKAVQAINYREDVQAKAEKREPVEFKDLYPHAIRHTFCSRCFEKKMEPKIVQQLMGHAHYSTTIDIYTHVTNTVYDEEIKKFGCLRNGMSEVKETEAENSPTHCA